VMAEISRRTVLVCDSSKFGRRSLSLIAPMSSIQQVITDNRIPKSDAKALEEAGIAVTIV
jgi:DeoR family transcriptional regulator, aga operon transcriptional repressor